MKLINNIKKYKIACLKKVALCASISFIEYTMYRTCCVCKGVFFLLICFVLVGNNLYFFQLSEKKAELAGLYKELQDTRGFSEDCERSILHQLICFLVKIISRSDSKVCIPYR